MSAVPVVAGSDWKRTLGLPSTAVEILHRLSAMRIALQGVGELGKAPDPAEGKDALIVCDHGEARDDDMFDVVVREPAFKQMLAPVLLRKCALVAAHEPGIVACEAIGIGLDMRDVLSLRRWSRRPDGVPF